MTIPLQMIRGEPRADTRMLAEQLGIQHASAFKLVNDYQSDFEQLGLLRFEIGAVKEVGARGTKHHKFALLNEDQSYLLLTFSRNTAKVRQLKVNLVKAFKQARTLGRRTTTHDRLPMQHAVLDIAVDRRLAPSAVQGAVNRFMGVKRCRYASVAQLGDGQGFCGRLLGHEETQDDMARITNNHTSLYGETRQLPLLGLGGIA